MKDFLESIKYELEYNITKDRTYFLCLIAEDICGYAGRKNFEKYLYENYPINKEGIEVAGYDAEYFKDYGCAVFRGVDSRLNWLNEQIEKL